jgi:Predicted membrane protein
MENKNSRIVKVIQTGVLAALCFVSFTFLSIKIPVGEDAVSLHIGNTFCVLAALLLGGWYGGLSGAIGMTISDLLDPTYAIGGLAFNVVFDPIAGYFYKQYILGQPQQMAAVLAKISVFATFVNAVVSVILVSIIYNAIRPVLSKSGLLLPVGERKSILK